MNFVKEIGGGCKIPIAAHAEVTESMIKMDGMMVSSNGIDILREYLECDLDKYENTGNTLAKKLLSKIR
jgi:hydroxymethylbilane synthase